MTLVLKMKDKLPSKYYYACPCGYSTKMLSVQKDAIMLVRDDQYRKVHKRLDVILEESGHPQPTGNFADDVLAAMDDPKVERISFIMRDVNEVH